MGIFVEKVNKRSEKGKDGMARKGGREEGGEREKGGRRREQGWGRYLRVGTGRLWCSKSPRSRATWVFMRSQMVLLHRSNEEMKQGGCMRGYQIRIVAT